MNFQTVQQSNGNKVDMLGVLTEVGGVGLNDKQKAVQKVKIRDLQGKEHKVTLYNTDAHPTEQHLGQTLSFSLKSYQGNYQGKAYTGYSGFWNQAANTNPTAPYIPPAQPQQVYNPPMPLQNMPSDKFGAKNNHSNNSTEKDWIIVRQCCIKAAAEYCGNAVAPDSVIDVAELWAQYCMTGKIEQPQKEEEAPDDDIPF